MDYKSITAYPTPPALSLKAPSTQYRSIVAPSGETEIFSEEPITLKTLLVSWQSIMTPGELHIGPFLILQSQDSGQLVIPCHDVRLEEVHITNNSYGGRYSIVGFYEVAS